VMNAGDEFLMRYPSILIDYERSLQFWLATI